MLTWLRELDRLLRGELTDADSLGASLEGRGHLSLRRFVPLAAALGAAYGLFMGWYAVARHWGSQSGDGWMQLLAGMVKLPALFLFTLIVTFPSLYVFNALVGTRLGFLAVLRLLVAAITVNLAVAASFGPILGFFTFSTTSYPFMVVLNVALLGVAGCVGLGFLLQALRRLDAPLPAPPEAPPTQPDAEIPPGSPRPVATLVKLAMPTQPGAALPPRNGSSHAIFGVWLIIYALVGMQMGWLLRPFIGHPAASFEWFRARDGNFFQGLFENLSRLVGAS